MLELTNAQIGGWIASFVLPLFRVAAQQMTVNHWVPGSSPGRGANFQSGYSAVR